MHRVDVCVVGGGMAGLCAALSAARHGASVALMHDRPVLGGNSSSECRVHICGADRHNQLKNMRETGILEELRMDNLRRNPNRNFSIWDTILYEKLRFEPNVNLLLNCSCMDAAMQTRRIESVTGWQLTTQTRHVVEAKLFIDCSGDAVLAPLSGAEHRMGREAQHEFGESIAPEQADDHTMGMTCLFQSRKHDAPQSFESPSWAHRFDRCEDLPYGSKGHTWWQMGYWWVELGGLQHGIHDAEAVRDELLKLIYGVWDHIKNRCPRRAEAENWAIEWVQFLPAKRESRRYVGAHVLTQLDIASGGHFDDVVAYGGWTMDDHHPVGFGAVKLGVPATVFHKAPSPYGIPWRSLHSKNVANLMFAGRDASCTHAAMSSTRVMGTGCSMGQAVGTAAALAVGKNVALAEIDRHMNELQQTLLVDDCYLPGVVQRFPDLTTTARLSASQGDPEPVRNGVNRPVGDNTHSWTAYVGDSLTYTLDVPVKVARVTLVLDSALDRNVAMSWHQPDDQLTQVPDVMPKAFRLDGLEGDAWRTIAHVTGNHQRLVVIEIDEVLSGVRFVLEETWGSDITRVYAFHVA